MLLAAMFGFVAYGLLILKVETKDPVWWDAVRAVIGVVVTIGACVEIAREDRNHREQALDDVV